jgi:Zn-dependent M28 family amino/carboxypeptidase
MEVIENLKTHVQILSQDIGIRSILEADKLEQAALYVESEFESAGLHVVRQEYETHWAPATNIVARTANWLGDKPVLVVGAHYDTVIISPGADDNASSVAVLIETARKIVQEAPEKTANMLFIAFSTEEPPCYDTEVMGSRVFVDRIRNSPVQVGGALVLEMVGYFSDEPGSQNVPERLEMFDLPEVGNFIAVVADYQSSEMADWIHRGIEESGAGLPAVKLVNPLHLPVLSSVIKGSDNASFWDAGIPATMLNDTAFLRNPNYHKDTDTADTLDYDSMARLVKALTYTLITPSALFQGTKEIRRHPGAG